jgi:hypothetical protein
MTYLDGLVHLVQVGVDRQLLSVPRQAHTKDDLQKTLCMVHLREY